MEQEQQKILDRQQHLLKQSEEFEAKPLQDRVRMLQTLHDNPAFCQILLYLQDRQRGLQATALNSLPASPSSEDNKAGEDGLAFIVNHFAQIGEARAASIAELLFFNLYEQLNQELKEKKDAGNKSE